MNTERLWRYLSTLERRPHVDDLNRVSQAIADLGIPVEPWLLDFHCRYAGIVQPLGPNDEAVLGILHQDAKWLGTDGIDGDSKTDDWMICCADAHPSYGYQLMSNQHFVGGSGSTFETFMDRNALWHDFSANRKVQYVVGHPNAMDEIAWRIIEETGAVLDPSSDDFEKLYLADQFLIRVPTGGSSLVATIGVAIPGCVVGLGAKLNTIPFWPAS